MHSMWDETIAATLDDGLALRVYSSRLLGANPALVLHGGGNTSIKLQLRDFAGNLVDVLYIKGSGADLAMVGVDDFAPVRLTDAQRLATIAGLDDAAMMHALRCACLQPGAPVPSVETLLHALIPTRYVDHTHAEAVLTLLQTPDARKWITETYGQDVIVMPYVMPGIALAQAAIPFLREQTAATQGLVVLNHGIFTWGATARESYERMIALVGRAEQFVHQRAAWHMPTATGTPPARVALANLRRAISDVAGAAQIVRSWDVPEAHAFVQRADLASVTQRGCVTPDHVIRTKRLPMIGRDVTAYADAYRTYIARQQERSERQIQPLDPAPRVVLDTELGLLTAGRTARSARIAGDIALQTLRVIDRAERLGGYQALGEDDLFAMEYWDLEQDKLRREGTPPQFAGNIALVTGAASGIGRACVVALQRRGAAVVGLDRDAQVAAHLTGDNGLGIVCDVTDAAALGAALDAAVRHFGGLDMLVLNAGIFPPSTPIAQLDIATWQRTMAINLDANAQLLQLAHPLLAQAVGGGRVVVIGSKNVPAPGPGAAAYSAAKAALTQLARVAALEWGADGIRVNIVHPNAVFDTAIWTPDVLAARAASYGLSVAAYKTNNLLRVEVTSHDVGELVAEMCGDLFAKTTGAQVPIDGGNDRVV